MQTVTINDEQIPVEVGQVWAATGKDRYARVIDVDGLLVAYWFCEAGSRKAVSVDVGYFITFTTLIKHRGADIDLEKYRYLWDQMPDDCTDCIDGYCRLRIRRKQEPEYCECGYTTYQARWGYTTVQFYKNRFELLTRDAHCNVCKNKINPVWTWNEGDPRPPKMPKNTENRYRDHGAWVQTGATSIKQLHVYMNNSNGSYRWNILDNESVFDTPTPATTAEDGTINCHTCFMCEKPMAGCKRVIGAGYVCPECSAENAKKPMPNVSKEPEYCECGTLTWTGENSCTYSGPLFGLCEDCGKMVKITMDEVPEYLTQEPEAEQGGRKCPECGMTLDYRDYEPRGHGCVKCGHFVPESPAGRKVYKLEFDQFGSPYYTKPTGSQVWELESHQIDGVAYTRSHFEFKEGYTCTHWVEPDTGEQASQIVFVKVGGEQ